MKHAILIFLIVSILSISIATASNSNIQDKRQELEDVNRRIDRAKDELEEINQRQGRTINEIENIEEQKEQTTDKIESINDKLLATQKEIEAIDVQLTQNNNELNLVTQNLEDTQEELAATSLELDQVLAEAQEHETLMAKRVRAMYMNRNTSYIELLLEADSISELFVRLEIIGRIVSFDNEALRELENYRDEVNRHKKIFKDKETEIEELLQVVNEQKLQIVQKKNERSQLLERLQGQQLEHETLLDNLERQKQQRSRVLANLEVEEEKYERELDELERVSKQLERKIQELTSEQERHNQRLEFAGGQMQWPVPGFYRVTSPFGYRVHPVFGTRRMHAGIDIGSNITDRGRQSIYGRNFVAAADGIVIFAGRFGGYGNTVIIDHGDGITTLYAHGSRILVSDGQRIKRGQPVMTVGSTGVSTGAHAHFEVRVNGVPVDPMPYLRGR